ncbi:MAG: hypothetical protein ABSE82_01595 [Nitrososphaerales archaeon]
MKHSRLLLLSTVVVFAIGIALSFYFNSLFIFIPFGLGWTVSRKSEARHESDEAFSKENPQS